MGLLKYIGGVYGAVSEYGRQNAQANADAERNLSSTFGGSSTEADAMRVAGEASRLKKERNISLRNSLRSHMRMQ